MVLLIEAIHELLVTNQSHLSTLFFLSCTSILHANTDGRWKHLILFCSAHASSRTYFDTYSATIPPSVRERGGGRREIEIEAKYEDSKPVCYHKRIKASVIGCSVHRQSIKKHHNEDLSFCHNSSNGKPMLLQRFQWS